MVGAMLYPGGGSANIDLRIKKAFFLINITHPSQKSIQTIYG